MFSLSADSVYNFVHRNTEQTTHVNYQRIIGLALGLIFAGQTVAQVSIPETDGSMKPLVNQNLEAGLNGSKENRTVLLREWLQQRKQARKQGGAEGNRLAYRQPIRREFAPVGVESHREASEPRAILHIGRGADGRIHHRYVFNDEGPDQLQVYSGSGYAPAETFEDATKPAGERAANRNPARHTRIAGLSAQASPHSRRR
ncbi:MAG: hypothetical protein PHE55_23400 [Methylococcaceae bacterium]|nr:hypothetical protein [Methylococcaceae bacterium]